MRRNGSLMWLLCLLGLLAIPLARLLVIAFSSPGPSPPLPVARGYRLVLMEDAKLRLTRGAIVEDESK